MNWKRWAPALLVGLLAAGFAWANRGEAATIRLGFFTLYRAPLALLVLGAFLLGMLAMFLLGLRHDLRIRRALRKMEARDATELYPREYASSDPT
jgi:uncharacterized integral membrane protein